VREFVSRVNREQGEESCMNRIFRLLDKNSIPEMKKPVIQDYGINDIDIKRSKAIKKWLKIIAIGQMFLGWYLFLIDSKGLWLWYFFVVSIPPYGPLIMYFTLKGILRLISHTLHATEKYENDCNTFEQWWIRTKKIFWQSLSGRQFEHELANLFRKLGHKADVTTSSDDKGVDIWLVRNGQRIPVQCKAHKRPIGPAVAREFYGVIIHFKSDIGILASLSGFTKGVFGYTSDKPIELTDLDWILRKQKELESY
jgi:restriction system protein